MKRRLFLRLLILLLLAALTCFPALADVIWEPNDSFYQQKSEDCVYNGRSYTASGRDGSVSVFKEPGSKETAAVINNGNVFYVSFTYTDKEGAEWGVVEFNPDGSGNLTEIDYSTAVTGWIPMTDLTVVYDYISFAEDHSGELKPYTGDYDTFKAGGTVVFWSYPGSGVVAWEDGEFKYDEYFEITDTYTDSEDRLWGFVGYYYGARNVWVCVSDPSGAGIEKTPPSELPEATSASPETELPTAGNDQKSAVLLIAVIVAAVVIVTGVLIGVFWKKSAKKDGAAK
jgi:hypothetical protein